MHYTSGNHEAFARPRKTDGVEDKTAWVVGSGLAALAKTQNQALAASQGAPRPPEGCTGP